MLLTMPRRKFESYPENVPGAFYVQKDLCITCRAPESVASDLIGFYADPSGTNRMSHCYLRKQPETAEELDRAINAVWVSCCGAYRYAGVDPAAKEGLRLLVKTQQSITTSPRQVGLSDKSG